MGKKKQKKLKKVAKKAAKAMAGIDTSLALARPLTTTQGRSLVKISDTDRAIANQVLDKFQRHADALSIPGLDPSDLEAVLAHSNALEKELARAEKIAGRLRG